MMHHPIALWQGGPWWMGGMGLFGLLILVLVVLAIAALIKYLFRG